MQSNRQVWASVPGFEGFYEVSTDGMVRSVDRLHQGQRTRFFKGQEIKQRIDNNGYPTVCLRKVNVGYTFKVHRLMALAFLPTPPPEYDRVCHINDIRTDNRIENLMWGNASINGHHAVANGRHYEAARTHCHKGHEYVPGSYSVRVAKGTKKSSRCCLVCKRIETNERRARERLGK